jgi:hypothetical protein
MVTRDTAAMVTDDQGAAFSLLSLPS